MKKKVVLILIIIFSFLCLAAGGTFAYFNANLQPVDAKNNDKVEVVIPSGTAAAQVIAMLKEKDLIKNEFVTKVYAKVHSEAVIAGKYTFSKSMSTSEIWQDICEGNVTRDTIWVTFIEGKRLSYIASQIAANFPYTEDEVNKLLDDKEYIKELIQKYNVLTDDILNEKIYHPLEGYLFADTYEFEKDATLKEIIEKMIGTLDSKVKKYKDDIANSKYSIHELLTLASIVELEASKDERKGVAGVFYNRLKSGWSLGSDVTTYYAVNKNFDKDLTRSELNSCNAYNTRGSCVKGLPAGPIGSPSESAIEAAIYPEEHDYYYFVDDKYGKTYYSKTDSEHNATIRRLQSQGLWFTY